MSKLKDTIKLLMKGYQRVGTGFLNTLIKVFYSLEYSHIHKYVATHQALKASADDEFIRYKNQFKKLGCSVPKKAYKIFAPYLQKNGVAGWKVTPENVIANFISPILNPVGYRKFYEDKNVYGILFDKSDLPVTLLRKMAGIYLDEDYNRIENINNKLLQALLGNYDRVIVKPTIETSSGRGVLLFIKQPDNSFLECKNTQVELTVEFLEANYGNDFIIQECLVQSPFMSNLNEDSVNTFRIGCYKSVEDNEPKILFVGIRMGVKGSYVDNTHAGGAKIRVNPDGSLADYAVEGYGDIVSQHNDVDFSKSHLVVPNFDQVIGLVKKLHSQIPHLRLIAFDVMLDKENKPKLVEFNVSGFSTWLPQWTGQCVLGNYTEEIVSYCAAHKKEANKVTYFIN